MTKRGGRVQHFGFSEELIVSHQQDPDLVGLDEALERLAALDPGKAHVVEMRFFGGLSMHKAVENLTISEATVRRDWPFAKTWLIREISSWCGHGT